MRTISINKKSYKIRPFKLKELKVLSEKYGKIGYFNQGLTVENHDELINEYIALQKIPTAELDEMYLPDIRALIDAVLAETWGDKKEEKNSSPSGDGSQTENA